MRIAMGGLGKMGLNVPRRPWRGGHEVGAVDRAPSALASASGLAGGHGVRPAAPKNAGEE